MELGVLIHGGPLPGIVANHFDDLIGRQVLTRVEVNRSPRHGADRHSLVASLCDAPVHLAAASTRPARGQVA